MRNNNESGFSIPELFTVSAIVAITATLAVPSFIGFVNAQVVRSDAESVQRFLQEAQSEAKKKSYQSELNLANCQTDSECDTLAKEWGQQALCEALIPALKPSNKLLWEMYKTGYLHVYEDGTCSMSSTPMGNQHFLIPFALEKLPQEASGESW